MTTSDPRDESDLYALLHEAERSGHELHRFWFAPKPIQQERYEKILISAIETAREGGYEAVQMREIARRSGVALATVYTYFTSRDYLVYRAMITWISLLKWQVSQRLDAHPLATDEDRFVAMSADLCRSMCAEPRLLEAWVRSTMTRDALVVEAERGVDWTFWAAGTGGIAEGSDLWQRRKLAHDVFFAGVVRWAFGQEDLDQVIERSLAIYAQRPGALPATS